MIYKNMAMYINYIILINYKKKEKCSERQIKYMKGIALKANRAEYTKA